MVSQAGQFYPTGHNHGQNKIKYKTTETYTNAHYIGWQKPRNEHIGQAFNFKWNRINLHQIEMSWINARVLINKHVNFLKIYKISYMKGYKRWIIMISFFLLILKFIKLLKHIISYSKSKLPNVFHKMMSHCLNNTADLDYSNQLLMWYWRRVNGIKKWFGNISLISRIGQIYLSLGWVHLLKHKNIKNRDEEQLICFDLRFWFCPALFTIKILKN